MRTPAARVKPRIAKPATFPAPVDGWIKNINLATPNARNTDGSKVSGAFVLENWFPTATGIRMRGGSQSYAMIDGSTPVTSMFSYANGNNKKLFATNESAIYDISNPPPARALNLTDTLGNFLTDQSGNYLVVTATSAEATLAGLVGGKWIATQFATPGGVFLRLVNGVDTPLVYDGDNFTTTPAITGVSPESLSYVWPYKNRLFFIKKESLSAWYLAADSIGGAAVELPLGGVFTRGGSLLFGSAWSIESGSGLSEQCVFVTTEGEVAVYQGNDPSVAASWTKVGVYRIGKPLGPKAHIRAGGDLVIATDIGFVPLSQAVQRDFAALSPSAVSYKIETAWNDEVAARQDEWNCEVWPTKQMVLVALPTPLGSKAKMFAANARTGAWGLFTGWNGTCLQLFGNRMFFGSTSGLVVEAEVTGLDQNTPYTGICVPLFDPLKSPAALKTSQLMRATLRSSREVIPQLSLQRDYVLTLPTVPDDLSVVMGSIWGVGIWGQSTWSSEQTRLTFQRWQSVGGSGYSLAPAIQITSGGIIPPDIELVQVDMTYDQGDLVS